jgi:hypothetical protein
VDNKTFKTIDGNETTCATGKHFVLELKHGVPTKDVYLFPKKGMFY